MSDSVQQIKERLSIVDVVAPYTELAQAGKHFKGKSPFTNEKTPSFYVSPDRGMYYCFSSSKGGDIFTFIQEMEGVDFKGALGMLAERAGVELVKEDPKQRDARDKKYTLIDAATTFFEERLPESAGAMAYISSRGVTKETIQKWRIGYAPDAWRELKFSLAASNFSIAEMQAAGMIKGDPGKEPYDVFRDRIMFPISDANGRVVAFSGRLLKKDDKAPKYVNSPETELFNKSEVLFGYDKAKQGIRKFDFSLIVEGQFDLVLAHQSGYTNAVAVSGTALSEHHVMLLQRLSNRAVLALDSDRAGIEAIKRAAGVMLRRGMDVKVAEMEEGKDPADIIMESPEAFKKVIGDGKHVIEFLLSILKREAKDERAYKLRAREEILPYLLMIPNHIDREHFVGIIAAELGTTKDAIGYEVERLSEAGEGTVPMETNKPVVVETDAPSRIRDLTEYLVALAVVMKDSDEHRPKGVILWERLQAVLDNNPTEFYEALPEDTQRKLIFSIEAELDRSYEKELVSDIVTKLTELHRTTVKAKMTANKLAMQEAETMGETDRLQELLVNSGELQKALSLAEYEDELFLGKKPDPTSAS